VNTAAKRDHGKADGRKARAPECVPADGVYVYAWRSRDSRAPIGNIEARELEPNLLTVQAGVESSLNIDG